MADVLWPDDEALFVRFGECRPWDLAYSAWRCKSFYGVWGLSMWWFPGHEPALTVEHAWRAQGIERGANPFKNSCYRPVRAGDLIAFDRRIGWQKTGGAGHWTMDVVAEDHGFDYHPMYDDDTRSNPAYVENKEYFDGLGRVFRPRQHNFVKEREPYGASAASR